MDKHRYTNALIEESSPYLRQHAHNPVNWHAWNEKTLEKARRENKLIIVSIGYSTCHWCHVMERESFEDSTVAAFMNEHFISIKVDREERPDIDQVYMQAVQMMTGQGGWPLNCIALPDRRPLFGGTYFPKDKWLDALRQMAQAWQDDPDRCRQYASELTAGMKRASLVNTPGDEEEIISVEELNEAVHTWAGTFDDTHGGPNRAPKFPMPVNYRFLLRYHYHTGDRRIIEQVTTTLDHMARGGIYDHVGGGFSRYSTDMLWKVPHFEKMLYDNAQLVSLYADAYRATGNAHYKRVVYETMEFIERELTGPDGGFYSALDADSDGEEGKFYIWTPGEIDSLLGENAKLFSEVYNVNDQGLWENGTYILLKRETDEDLAKRHGMEPDRFHEVMKSCKSTLLAAREKRTRPGLDDKIITSWNALMVTACCDAFDAFGEREYLESAEQAIRYIERHLYDGERLLHSTHPSIPAGERTDGSLPAFLDDHALLIQAYLSLYGSTNREAFLKEARRLADAALDGFFDDDMGMFRFTHKDGEQLITHKYETEDNVIPASNSVMAMDLFALSRHFDLPGYEKLARRMLAAVKPYQASYPSAFANWNRLAMCFLFPFHEVVVAGPKADVLMKSVRTRYLPNAVTAATAHESTLPLLENRYDDSNTLIYVCTNKSCRLPVKEVDKAMGMIRRK